MKSQLKFLAAEPPIQSGRNPDQSGTLVSCSNTPRQSPRLRRGGTHSPDFRIFLLLIFILQGCIPQKIKPAFTFRDTGEGIELQENGQSVFFYQKKPKSLSGEYICNNYLHPLYDLRGDTLTEEFPPDHPYHRGIFWAWHQVYAGNNSVGDGWIMENIEHDITGVQTTTGEHFARLVADVLWKSPLFENRKPFISERTAITVHALENDNRKIDFVITMKALVPGVEIGGSDDEKGYGGFCARLKLPENLTFTSTEGAVTPRTLQIESGPWMDFSGSFGKNEEISGVSVLCHPSIRNYPAPWILRSQTSMQNIVFPGRDRIGLPLDTPLVLFYRLIVHNGDAGSIDLNMSQTEFEQTEPAESTR